MRGEKRISNSTAKRISGSSPHARGKAGELEPANARYRIIPACAGKRVIPCWSLNQDQDHPRMRGEKPVCPCRSRNHIGSSPHARGKVPTHATCVPSPQDHPRMRGEKDKKSRKLKDVSGSSPHARGKAVSSTG